MATWSQQSLKGDLWGQQWGSNCFLWLDVQSSWGYRAGREIRKRSSDQYWNPEITTSHYLSLLSYFHFFISPRLSVFNLSSVLKLLTTSVLFALSLSFGLYLLGLMSVSLKISQISHQQGLSRKSTLLTLLWMEGGGWFCRGELVVNTRHAAEWRSFDGSNRTMFVGGLD